MAASLNFCKCPSVTVVTNQTSPYQVEFMNAIARSGALDLRVIYLHSQRPGRQWPQLELLHQSVIIDGDSGRIEEARRWVNDSDLVVFSYYRDPAASTLMDVRVAAKKPWCFWGERMGVTRMAWAGSLYRRWKLRCLHRSCAAIWGIGEFALERYRREFGNRRAYCNVPYFSDLARFESPHLHSDHPPSREILFSGSLISRKGVDVLAEAFCIVASECPNLRLTWLGDGPLRASLEQQLSPWAERVRFLGFRDWTELPQHYRAADLLCAPSCHDGWALVVPEALASGLPVMGTRQTGATRELVREGVNGWIIDAGDVSQLADTLRAASRLTDAQLSAMSRAAVQSVSQHQLADGVLRFQQAVETTLHSWHQ